MDKQMRAAILLPVLEKARKVLAHPLSLIHI